VKTITVRFLVHDDVDEDHFVAQTVSATGGSGAPLGAVQLVGGRVDVPVPDVQIYTRPGISWHGERIDADAASSTTSETSVDRVKELARRLYPTT
jgi:hypothetical protein